MLRRPSTIPACTRNRDALGVVARVAFPHAIGPEDGIGRFRKGIRGPKVAAAFQADPELVELPGFPGTWIREIHERAATLAAHLEIDIAHDSYSSAEVSQRTRPASTSAGFDTPQSVRRSHGR